VTLSAQLQLHDVQDVECLCRGVMRVFLRSLGSGAYLTPHHEDEMFSHLLEHTWRLYRKFDTTRNTSFAGYARSLLERRCVDWYRSEFGRGGGKQTPDGSWSLDDAGGQADRETALAVMDDPEVALLLDVLPMAQQRIILARIEGVPRAELARRLGVSQKTAAMREAWALQELRVHYPDWSWPEVGIDASVREDHEEAVAA
jgi:RNA polymerase sigma factor (sigma-70 family)